MRRQIQGLAKEAARLRGAYIVGWSLCLFAAQGCVRNYGTDQEAPDPSAERYTVDVTGGGIRVVDSDVAKQLFDAVVQGHGAPLVADGRLGLLAEHVGERLGPAGLLPEPEQVEFLARRLGLVDPSPLVLLAPQGPIQEVAAELEEAVASSRDTRPASHMGMALARAYGRSFWVLVLTERRLELSPVPRAVAVGTELRVAGALPTGFKNPRINVQTRDGHAEELPSGAGPRFDVRIPTPRPAVLQLELSAEGAAGRSVLAAMAVYVGREPPEDWSGKSKLRPIDVNRAETLLVEAIQGARVEQGLEKLVVDRGLSQMASHHSTAMGKRAVVGHEIEQGQSPPVRVRSAGYNSGLVLENVARGRDPLALHDNFMVNPGQRSAVLHPQVTHLGVGVARVHTGTGDFYYVTEVFVGVPEQIEPAAAPGQVLVYLNQARAARGAVPLQLDDALSAVAQGAVDAYFSPPFPTQQATLDGANSELGKFAISYSKAAAVMAIVSSLKEAAALEPALDPSATHLGVAAGQKQRPGEVSERIGLVLTLGWARGSK